MILPVHVKDAPSPELVNPVLHVQTTALVVESCEHTALILHPPLFTLHMSDK